MSKNGKIRNTSSVKININNTIDVDSLDSHLRKNRNIVFDFSFWRSFISCAIGNFNNFLKDEQDFILKFLETMQLIEKLSSHTVSEIFDGKHFRHCHDVDDGKEQIVLEAMREIGKITNLTAFEQRFGDEKFCQVGLNGALRIIGIVHGNIFKVCLVDYYHNLYPDEKHNTRTKQSHKYSIGKLLSPNTCKKKLTK